MKNQMTLRDYELISAFLDNQLGSRDRTQFEARLKIDPELRKELHEISKTRLLVRNLPNLRAPRNYYINANAVRARPTLRFAPALGIVSAIASILLALVIFGNTLLSSSSQVALVPASMNTSAPVAVEQEVQRIEASPITPTESAPSLVMGAQLNASPTPFIGTLKSGQTENATPTTIYLYAFPPTATQENQIFLFTQQTENAGNPCEEYLGSGLNPTPTGLTNCPTATSTLPLNLQGLLTTTSPTPVITLTQTLTLTPTATATPTPTPSYTPNPTVAPPSVLGAAPSTGTEVPSDMTPPGQALDTGNPTPSGLEQAEKPKTSPDVSFLRYVLLAVEISLASIAIIAGLTAVILRIRAGR
jgi:hypothetical protein